VPGLCRGLHARPDSDSWAPPLIWQGKLNGGARPSGFPAVRTRSPPGPSPDSPESGARESPSRPGVQGLPPSPSLSDPEEEPHAACRPGSMILAAECIPSPLQLMLVIREFPIPPFSRYDSSLGFTSTIRKQEAKSYCPVYGRCRQRRCVAAESAPKVQRRRFGK
jgi:hypothetical protein